MRKHATWFGAALTAVLVAIVIVSCGGTGGGGGKDGNPDAQFILNSNRSGRFILNVNPLEVDANKSDRLGLVATLTDSLGNPIAGTLITFSSDIDDISFIPGQVVNERNFGFATTDSNGNADIIAVAGTTPTGTGAIVGTGALFAQPPPAFGLRAQANVTLLDVGFIDADALAVIPPSMDLVEPGPDDAIFFNIVGGLPPYGLNNETSGIGTATLSQHCAPGCTENGGVLCVGSPCQSDPDCGVGSPAGTCIGAISRCLASCAGTNCAGALCETDSDCNDGSATPANVCKDSGQSIVYNIGSGNVSGTHGFTVFDSAGASVRVDVSVTFVCGNGVARGDEQCDITDMNDSLCEAQGLPSDCTLTNVCEGFGVPAGGTAFCNADCTFTVASCPTPVPTASPAVPVPTTTP